MAMLDHGLQRGKDFFVGKVPGGAEEDESIRLIVIIRWHSSSADYGNSVRAGLDQR